MSTINFRANALGRAGIWTGDDDAPYTAPRSNLARVKFHTDLDYIRVIDEVTVTLNLPAISNVLDRVVTHNLFAHGRPGFPYILGKVRAQDGADVAFTGSVPVQFGNNATSQYARWLALGADATNVSIHEYVMCNGISGGSPSTWETYDALSLSITVYITDEILE